MIVTEHLLFAAHEGSVGSQRAAIIMHGHCLPIACSHQHAEADIYSLWESESGDVETFFQWLGIANVCRGMGDTDPLVGGLFVYSVEYDDGDVDDDWEHLRGGDIRRPSGVELLRMSQSKSPWEGGVVL